MADTDRSRSDPGGEQGLPTPSRVTDLIPLIYEELRHLAHFHMRREPAGHTLQTTAVVHEAYLRMARQQGVRWESRSQFFAVASQMIRRVLVDHARARNSQKRGGRARPVAVSTALANETMHVVDVLALDEALSELAELDERQSRVVELRYFGGLSIQEIAQALSVSPRTVKGDWRIARVWLKQRLDSESFR